MLLALGAALLIAGILGLRVMARRSVSLRALAAIARGQEPDPCFDEGFASRIPELLAWRLAFERGERIEITPFGRRVARLVRVLRTLAGVPT